MLNSPYLGLYIFLGIVLLIAVLIVWGVRAGKKRLEQRRQMFLEFGFQDVPERGADLTERMKTLHHHWSDRHCVEDVKRKSEWGYELLLFDLRDSSGDSTHTETDQTVLISPDLKFPRFSVFPKAEGTGIFANMANKLLAWISAKFAVQVAFPDHPGFEAKYLVWGDDESALRGFFSASRIERLTETRELQIEGNGDGLLFTRMLLHRTKRTDVEKLQDILQTAKALFDIFKE